MNPAALQLLLHALAQRPVQVAPWQGLERPVLAPTQLLLPADAAAPAGAAVAHAAAHLLHSRAGQATQGRKPLALAVLSAVEDARVERLLVAQWPGLRRWFAVGLPLEEIRGLGFPALMARLDRVLADPAAHDGHHWLQRAQQGFWSLPADAPANDFARLGLVLANMLGQMRVPFDMQYRPAAYRDDHSYLWDHGRTADSETEAKPLAAGATAPGTADAEPALATLRERHYGEWHEKLGLWRPAWCRVQERALAGRGPAPAPQRRRLPPAAEGEMLDLQAGVAAWTDRRRGQRWEPRLFHRMPAPLRASVLLLLDLSQSTQAPWGGGPLSVQAAQQRAALWLAQRLAARGARVAVHGFASNGRAEVAYWRAVDFGARCDAAVLAALPVQHSTRLGAALRHAQALLATETSPRRGIVLLSDGQPWDVDVFEPGHLLRDAHHAVQAGRRVGMQAGCLAFADQAVAALRPVFGAAGVHRLDPRAPLAQTLAQLPRGGPWCG